MYKVFINYAELRFTENRDPASSNMYVHHDAFDWERLYNQLKQVKQHAIHNIVHERPENALADFTRFFKVIEAAGGLVKNERGEVLMIYRLGKWDLPKGKMETGESPPNTAMREVEEECGVDQLTLKDMRAFITYHTYEMNDERILKRTYWYRMQSNFAKQLVPQTEEGITKVEWVPQNQTMNNKLKKTYQNIIEVIRALA